MESWDISTLDVQPHNPEVLASDDEGRVIVLHLPAGERLQEHQVHERAWLVVVAGAVEIDDAGRRDDQRRARAARGVRPQRAPRGRARPRTPACCWCSRPGPASATPRAAVGLSGLRTRGTSTRSASLISRSTRAGTPPATTPAGRSRTTTAPAPTTVSAPISTPGQTIAPAPSQTLSAIDDRRGALPARRGAAPGRSGGSRSAAAPGARAGSCGRSRSARRRAATQSKLTKVPAPIEIRYAVVAAKRLLDDDALADLPEQLGEDRVERRPGRWTARRCSARPGRSGAVVLAAELGVGAVELAAQQPPLHLAHLSHPPQAAQVALEARGS